MDIEILNEARLRYWCRRIDMPEGGVNELAQIAAEVSWNDSLLAIFTDFHQKTALRGEWERDSADLPVHPQVAEVLGERNSLFYLLAYLAAMPYAEREYLRRGIAMDIFHDTMRDISVWVQDAYDIEGVWRFRQFGWIWEHLSCELFRLGRLQFKLTTFDDQVTAYRHNSSGKIRLLAAPDVPLRADGAALGAGKLPPGYESFFPAVPEPVEESWLPVFEALPGGWRGHLISPYGNALKEEKFLPRPEWEQILKQGDTILDMHIPRKDCFNNQACADSLRQAHAFFQTFNPERPIRAGFCHTWFFTPQLQQILPPESNIVRFQREFYLYPFAGGPGFLWLFAFGRQYPNPATAPRDTSLRRGVLDWLAQGKQIFDLPGLMFHTPEEWGTQPYMREWDNQ
jgi:hypothetical protein